MKIYVDASFLVSLYGLDVNSAAAAEVMRSSVGDRIATTFGELEVVNGLALRVFRKQVSATQARASLDEFEKDVRDGVFRLLALPDEAFEKARQLSRQTTARLGTRTADLLHVAAALELKADCLYTFDQQQRKLAHAVHLKISQ